MTRGTFNYFAWEDRLFKEHHLAGLTSAERGVLWAFAHRAHSKGTAWPSAETIAAEIGTTARHVREAIASLKEKGFLEVVKKGGGYKNVTEYRLTLPGKTMPDSGTVSRVEKSAPNGQEKVPDSAQNSARSGRETVPDSGTGTTNRTTKEPPNNHAGLLMLLGFQVGREKAELLATRYTAYEIDAAIEHTTSQNGKLTNPAGWLVSVLEDGWTAPPPTPDKIAAKIKSGIVQRIGQHDVRHLRAKWNSRGILLFHGDDANHCDAIRAAELTPENIVYAANGNGQERGGA